MLKHIFRRLVVHQVRDFFVIKRKIRVDSVISRPLFRDFGKIAVQSLNVRFVE